MKTRSLGRRNLAVHTRRGLEAVIRSGRNAGGRAYSYRPVPGKPGELAIDDGEADIVRRIFREFTKGATPWPGCSDHHNRRA
jgi:site-specific DNA recombinase